MIVKYLKEHSLIRGDTQSVSSGGDPKQPRQNLFETRGAGTRSVRSDMSEEKFKEKQDEVIKTIKEKEFLQKRTHELLSAM